ncbi:hypothetical protein ACJW31_03G181500 [Castanea mollissima]
MVEKLKPSPRKWESFTMPRVKEVALISGPSSPQCKIQHKAPALVFSAGGYTGNFFHDFNDGFIPLFITANSVYPNQDVVLVISKARDWPILVLASRSVGVGRVLLNQNEVKLEAEKIGFIVTVFEPRTTTPLKESYALINSSHAMIGIHGAALTHSLFLRPGSVFVQVVPLGAEWVSQVCFEKSVKDMGLVYMEYRIKAEESSLIEKYDKDDMMIKDPVAYRGKSWSPKVMSIYLKEQNVKLDLVRFREYLKEMYKEAKKFMDKEG